MDNLAIQTDSSALTQYSRGQADKTYADQHESLLGHLICERGKDVKSALEDLRPIVKRTHKQTLNARDWCGKFGFGVVGLGVLVGASPMGVFLAIPPIVAGTISLKFWQDSRNEIPRREAEYHLLKTVADLPEALYALHLRGVDAVRLVGAYDALVGAIEARLEDGRDFSEAEVGEFLRVKIESRTGLETSTQAQSAFQPTNAQDAPRAEAQALAPTELQSHSPDAGNMVTAAAPSYGVVKNRTPVDILVAALFSHRAFYGGQRTGKSLLASAASAGIVEAAPGTKVFYLNLFAFDFAETQRMFGHAHKSVICDLAPVSKFEAEPTIAAAAALFTEFTQTTGAILIIDEAASMGDVRGRHIEALSPLVNNLVGYLSAIRDSSKKRRKAVWTVAPGIVAGNLDDGMKSLMKGFSPVLVAIPKHRSVDWEGQTLTTDTTIAGQLKSNYSGMTFDAPEMDCDRVCLIDSIWMPLGHLSIPAPSPAPETRSPSIEERKAKIERMKADIERLQERNDEAHDERISSGIDYEMHDSFDPPRERLERLWDIPAVEVEARAIDDKPDGLDGFPLVLTIWEYLDGKDARSMKQISGAMKTGGKISDDVLTAKLGQFETYKDAIKAVVSFGVSKGYLRQVSEDAYEAVRKH